MVQRLQLRGRLTPAVTWLVVIVFALALVWLFGGKPIARLWGHYLVLTPDAILRGEVWKLVTAPFVNPDGVQLVMDLLMLWLFVPVLERWWGTKRFLVFFAATALTGNVVSVLVGWAIDPHVVIAGLFAFVYASIAAFGVLFANHPVMLFGVIELKGKTLAIGATVMIAVVTLLDAQWVRGSGALAAMALAWIMTSGGFTPNLWMLKLRRWWLKRRYKIIDGGKRNEKRWIN
jgi:membrane associated rhomboid family serine protease